ncbi:MAG: TonB-dependent receptor, partial [Muribaculaceae bacterium]|nr:TonB-dependent receptor [Muribaculaceae bacterium]
MNILNRYSHFVVAVTLIIFSILRLNAAEPQGYITGKVTDANDGSPLAGASVMIGIKGVVTNADGVYSMPLPDKKTESVTLKFSYVSYLKKNITVTLPINGKVDVALVPDQNMLSEAVVQGTRHDFGVRSPQMSAVELSGAQLKNVPMVFGEPDLLKTIQRLPGVQSGKEGNSGIMVRGGGYDQNQLMLDGTMLYSTEHMKGFVTAVNPDMISSMAFYRGAFPALYGGRLSSVIDIATTEGDFETYHGAISAGLMIGRFNVSGPIVKGKTSFALAARASYFDMIFQPEAEKHYKKIGIQSPYTGMEFWDVNLKLAHRFSAKDKLTLLFLTDHDNQKTEVTDNYPKTSIEPYCDPILPNKPIGEVHNYTYSSPGKTSTRWSNRLGSLNWYHRFGENSRLHTSAGYSRFSYNRTFHGEQENSRTIVIPEKPDSIPYASYEITDLTQRSVINSFNLKSDYQFPIGKSNTMNVGLELKYITADPRRHILSQRDEFEDWSIWQGDKILVDMRDVHRTIYTDSLVGKVSRMFNGNIYLSDDMKYGPFEAIIGARLASYSVKNKTYLSFEPRFSASLMLDRNSSIKASVSRMSQGERLLTSTSLVSPSDIWVSITDSIPPMKSMTYSVSLNRQFPLGIEMSVEGYYKTIDNLTDYKEGSDFSRTGQNWENMIALGKGKSYGVEFMLQRMVGNTTGWLSYTWSKAISTFDRPGQSINSGKSFYSPADRRNNLSINLNHRINFNRFPGNHFDISGAFSYATGRKVTIPDHLTYAGMLTMFDHTIVSPGFSNRIDHIFNIHQSYKSIVMPAEAFDVYMRYEGYSVKNNLQLPDEMRLDISLSMTLKHLIGQSTVAIGATNILNRKNISDVFIGSDKEGNLIVKGVCNF